MPKKVFRTNGKNKGENGNYSLYFMVPLLQLD